MRRILVWVLIALLSLPISSVADESDEPADVSDEPLGWAQIAGGFEEDLITGQF